MIDKQYQDDDCNCCVICGEDHASKECSIVQFSKHVDDKEILPKAKLSLPDFLQVQTLSDGTFSVITKELILKGTRFGPFQAERTQALEPSVLFPLKIFSFDGNQNVESFLSVVNEDKCSWLMYVSPADYLEEQNLICYQEKNQIYYLTIKDIEADSSLKVWYSPYYASKMNKDDLPSKTALEEPLKDIDINLLVKKQQKIMERKIWTCKFCSHIENEVVTFAKHILKHYTAQHRNICEICNKMYGSKKHLKDHLKIVHMTQMSSSSVKLPKAVDSVQKTQNKDVALGGPFLNDIFTDSSDLQQSDLNQFDLSLDNQNLLLDNDNLNVDNLLNENVKDLDHFNFEIDDNQKQFVCDICLKQFNKGKLLILHLRHHTGDYMCQKCLKIFCRNENLKSHICNVESKHRCTLCGKSFFLKKYLSRHLDAKHNKKFQCVTCNKHYFSNKELLEHNCCKVPSGDKEKFMCPICDKYFYRDLYLKKHLKIHGANAKISQSTGITCEICGLHLESRNSYYMHKKIHEEPAFTCKTCNKKFVRLDTLREHSFTHESRQIECSVCKKHFKTKRLLKSHMKTHDIGKSFKCPKCDIIFKTRPTLSRHLRKHHRNEKNDNNVIQRYKCPVCQKSIQLKSSLQRHMRKLHASVTNIDFNTIKPKLMKNKPSKEKTENNNDNVEKSKTDIIHKEIDDQIDTLLSNAEKNSSIQKHAVDSLVEELEIDGKKGEKQAREVCLSIPELSESYQEIILDKNAYILENGTIVQPQGDSNNVVIYVLDQNFN